MAARKTMTLQLWHLGVMLNHSADDLETLSLSLWKMELMKNILLALFGLLLASSSVLAQTPIKNSAGQWPSAAGPNGTWATKTDQQIPTSWSVTNNSNIVWKTVLPEGGQGGIAVWKDRIFLTTYKPIPKNTPVEKVSGTDVVGYCLNARTGKILWTISIPSTKKRGYASAFGDNSCPTPVTNGKHVWFFNAGGRMSCFDMNGKLVWTRPFESRYRHSPKQCEPMLVGNQLLYVVMRDPKDPLRKKITFDPTEKQPKTVKASSNWPWTFIRSFDAATGQPLWMESAGTSVHNTPRIGYVNNEPFIFHARGGFHLPPETPTGLSLTSLSGKTKGKTIWSYSFKEKLQTASRKEQTAKGDFRLTAAYVVSHFDEKHAYGFDTNELIKLDIKTGKVLKRFPLFSKATIHKWNLKKKKYETFHNAPFSKVIGNKIFRAYCTGAANILVGKYYIFLAHEGNCICRVNTETGHVEYLQLPKQIVRKPNSPDKRLWDQHILADSSNSRGTKLSNSKHTSGDGWGHIFTGSPIAVNQYLFFSTVIGMTYVVDSQAKSFGPSALISINDLGPAGKTFGLSALSYSQGKIYHRGMKHIVCIGKSKKSEK